MGRPKSDEGYVLGGEQRRKMAVPAKQAEGIFLGLLRRHGTSPWSIEVPLAAFDLLEAASEHLTLERRAELVRQVKWENTPPWEV